MKTPLSKVAAEAKKLAKTLKGGEVIALTGSLGSGKTTFTQHLARALGIEHTVTSPTFVIMQEYHIPTAKKGPQWLYHLDLYRTKDFSEIQSLGIEQIWQRPETITVIEWADKVAQHLPKNAINYHFYRDAE